MYLSFNNGGYFPDAVGFAAICFCGALVLRTTLADQPFEGYNRLLAAALLAFGLFGLLQLVSLAWSRSAARALDDYDRDFLYLLVFALYGSLPHSTERVRWLIRSLAVAMSIPCMAGLITRTLPHVWPTALGFYTTRLSFPLGYWNGLGMMGAVACILLFHLASSLREPRFVRVGAAALFPAVAAGMLLTYSRGALGVAVIGLALFVILARPRGFLPALVAILPAGALALRSGYDATLLSGANPTSTAAVAQGRHVALIVGLSMAIAALLRAAALWADDWLRSHPGQPRLPGRIHRRSALGAVVAVAAIVLLVVGGPSFVGRQYNRFVSNSQPAGALTRDRLADPSSDGRIGQWRLSLQQFGHHPLLGGGAGSYQTYYAQHRSTSATVTDTHSLYLQTLGEDGLIGIVLLLAALLSIFVGLASQLRGPHRALYAALLAAAAAWAIHGAVDWDWQMPAVTLWLFAVGGLALASRQGDLAGPAVSVNRVALAASFLALAVAPLLIGFSYQRLRGAGAALAAGRCGTARDQALSSTSLLGVRPQAYEIIGYCDLEQGYPIEALAAMRTAASDDEQAWDYHYGLAIALAENGLDPISEAERAVALNPEEPIASQALAAFESTGADMWPALSQSVMFAGLRSGVLAVSNV